jgi:membrane-associated phospholipid phosphatase
MVNRFDRSATGHYSRVARRWSDYLLVSSIISPVIIEGIDNRNSLCDFGTVGLLYAEAALLNSAITRNAKGLFDRRRPYLYNRSISNKEKMTEGSDAECSFWSGHTSQAFCAASFLSKVYADMHPGSPVIYVVTGTSFTLASTIGLLRYRAGMHFPSDIIVGAVVGSIIGYCVPALHLRSDGLEITPVTGRSIGLSVSVAF